MRKLWIACLGVLMILGLVGCGTESSKTAEKTAPAPVQTTEQADSKAPAAKGKILVAYFSATGNTRTLEENTAKALNADLYDMGNVLDIRSVADKNFSIAVNVL